MKRKLKKNYIHENLTQHNGDAKKTWRTIKSTNTINKIVTKTNNHEMAFELNTHFTTIGLKLSSEIPPSNINHDILVNDSDTSFIFDEIKYEEVAKILSNLSPSKSCGIDGLTVRLIEACGEAIIPPLLHIFNTSVKVGVFPSIWKVAKVTQIFKEGKTDDPSNYRPISVLPVLSKVFERVIHDKTYAYISNFNLLNNRQSGFRKRHSTVTCLIEFLDAICLFVIVYFRKHTYNQSINNLEKQCAYDTNHS